ncbi:MAG: hypothetical protein GY861_21175 [bacterium]|nr:hypothetical protein [bacterium]
MNDRVKTVFADFANKCLTITNVDIIFESGILSMGKVEESGVIKVVVNVEDDLEIVSTLSFLLRVTKSDSSRNRNCKHLDWNELDHRVDISDRHGWLILNSICGEDVSVLIKEELPEYYGAVRKILLTLIRKRYNAALERYIYVMGNGDPKSPGGKRTWRTIGSDEGLAVLC